MTLLLTETPWFRLQIAIKRHSEDSAAGVLPTACSCFTEIGSCYICNLEFAIFLPQPPKSWEYHIIHELNLYDKLQCG